MRPQLRRAARRGVLATAVLGGVCVMAAGAALPGLIRSRAQAYCETRLGLALRIGSIHLTSSGVELADLRLAADGDGLVVRIDRVRAGLDFFRLAVVGRQAVERVDVDAVDVVVGGPSPALGRILRPKSSAEVRADSSSAALPPFSVAGLRVRVGDSDGVLFEGSCPSVRHARSLITAEGIAVTAGNTAVGTIELRDVSVTARRSDGWRLASTEIGHARIRLPTARKATEPLDDGRSLEPPEDLAEQGTAGLAGARASTAPDSQDPGGVAHRLRALLGAADAEPAQPGAGRQPRTNAVDQALKRLAPDATVLLLGGSVAGAKDGQSKEILRSLEFKLSHGSDGAWSFDGDTRGAAGGRVHWAFTLAEEPLAANGRLDVESMPLPLAAQLLPAIPWHTPERSHLSARLVLETRSVDRIGVSGVVDLTDASIASDRVAPVPVEDLDVSLGGQGHFMPRQGRLEIESGWLAVAGVRVDIAGSAALASGTYAADIRASLKETSCDKAIRAISPALLGDLVHASWDGTIAGSVALQIDSERLAETKLDIAVTDRCGFVTVPAIADLRRFRLPFVHTVLEPDGTVMELETGPGTTTWTYLEDVSPFLVHAVLSHEDSRFFSHAGFSPPHIRNALVKNLEQGRYVIGASTITMQLVKNIFLQREKTLARKTQEVLLTWWIERVMEKRDILELYLNVIEYGPGVYGIRNAAMHYFKRLPSDLSPAEAVYLSTILPNPRMYYGAYERGSISERWADRMRKIFARLRARGRYSAEATAYGLAELQSLRFVKEGEFATAREVPGTAAPLPYMEAPGGWGERDGQTGEVEEWDHDEGERDDAPDE